LYPCLCAMHEFQQINMGLFASSLQTLALNSVGH